MNLFDLGVFNVLIFIAIIVLIYLVLRKSSKPKKISRYNNVVVVDTSSLIDGRILDIAKTGFVTGKLYVPKFIIEELHQVADSQDPLKRSKGRRGLKILRDLQKIIFFKLVIVDKDYPEIDSVDSKLVKFAKDKKAKMLTVDFNLNEVAKIDGLVVLNINTLSNAIKPALLPGEKLEIKIVQKGKERNQGVGYLLDGTMVVVEEGAPYIGEKVKTSVSRIFQTDAGRIIFVKLGEKKLGPVEVNRRRRWIPRRPRLPRIFNRSGR